MARRRLAEEVIARRELKDANKTGCPRPLFTPTPTAGAAPLSDPIETVHSPRPNVHIRWAHRNSGHGILHPMNKNRYIILNGLGLRLRRATGHSFGPNRIEIKRDINSSVARHRHMSRSRKLVGVLDHDNLTIVFQPFQIVSQEGRVSRDRFV
ncbi:Uncharacterized protein Fot_37224 [Forsythia ovata]|uniref:Ribosomal protein S4 n=1 Tax=Forsythia ovata TaxID=205694 RepID=A0ABD1SRP3_9LAMI